MDAIVAEGVCAAERCCRLEEGGAADAADLFVLYCFRGKIRQRQEGRVRTYEV